MSTSEEQVTWLADLLHDIGKFYERTFEPLPSWAYGYRAEAKYSHEPYSALFVDEFMGGWTKSDHTTLAQCGTA
jgi:CRISPR/Cas system-associated endonuclease Cas3-HD